MESRVRRSGKIIITRRAAAAAAAADGFPKRLFNKMIDRAPCVRRVIYKYYYGATVVTNRGRRAQCTDGVEIRTIAWSVVWFVTIFIDFRARARERNSHYLNTYRSVNENGWSPHRTKRHFKRIRIRLRLHFDGIFFFRIGRVSSSTHWGGFGRISPRCVSIREFAVHDARCIQQRSAAAAAAAGTRLKWMCLKRTPSPSNLYFRSGVVNFKVFPQRFLPIQYEMFPFIKLNSFNLHKKKKTIFSI